MVVAVFSKTEVGTSKSPLIPVLLESKTLKPVWLESKKLRSLLRPLDGGWAVIWLGGEKKSSKRDPLVDAATGAVCVKCVLVIFNQP